MTYAQLKTRVTARMQALGARMDDLTVRPSDATGVAGVLTAGLQAWTAVSQSIRVTENGFSVKDGQSAYSLTGVPFTVPMLRVDQIRTDEGVPLTDYHGRPGPIALSDLETMEINWTAADESEPRVWARSGHQVILFPTPSADASWSCSGISLHPAVSLDADVILVDLRDEDSLVTFLAAEWAMQSQFSDPLAQARQMGLQGAVAASARNNAQKDPMKGGAQAARGYW